MGHQSVVCSVSSRDINQGDKAVRMYYEDYKGPSDCFSVRAKVTSLPVFGTYDADCRDVADFDDDKRDKKMIFIHRDVWDFFLRGGCESITDSVKNELMVASRLSDDEAFEQAEKSFESLMEIEDFSTHINDMFDTDEEKDNFIRAKLMSYVPKSMDWESNPFDFIYKNYAEFGNHISSNLVVDCFGDKEKIDLLCELYTVQRNLGFANATFDPVNQLCCQDYTPEYAASHIKFLLHNALAEADKMKRYYSESETINDSLEYAIKVSGLLENAKL